MVTGRNKITTSLRRLRRFITPVSIIAASVLSLFFFTALITATPAGEFVFPEARVSQTDVPASAAQPPPPAGTSLYPAAGGEKPTEPAPPPDRIPTLSSPSTGTGPAAVTVLGDGQTAVVRFDQDTGTPAFVTGDVAVAGANGPEEAAYAFLDTNRGLYAMKEPRAELLVRDTESDSLGMSHVRLDQVYRGIPVYGADLAVHVDASGNISAVNGKYIPGIDIAVEPRIDEAGAAASAREPFGLDETVTVESVELVVLAPAGAEARLVWKTLLVDAGLPLKLYVFVDAGSGEVVGSYDDLQDIRNRKTYTANNGTSLPGTLLITEGGSSGDAVAQAAHTNIGSTYDYFKNSFGRDSYNNAGANLTSTVHYGSSYNNAFWNGSQMTYGDGDGYVFAPLGNSLDVVAHELTHGVTQHSAGLIYSYQSGALNESYSDVFGVMVDRDDWLLGEDVYTPTIPGDALRSISNPTQFGQPAHMNNYVNTSSDNGGVHTNSGIPNKAAYNVAVAIGKDKMEQIWYRTLTMYLTSVSQFTDARDGSVQAATDLYGAGSPEVTAVVNGFNSVGIGGSQLSETTARIEIDHSYRGDLVVTLGVGDPDAPTWSTVVSNRSGGSADNVYQTVDIAEAVAYLPPDWQNRWFLKIYDAAGQDTGSLKKFSITDHGTTYTAAGLPLAVNDFETVIAYIPTSDSTPPTAVGFSPQANATGVYVDSAVTVEFSENVLASTVNDASFTLTRSGAGAVPAAISYNSGTRKATLKPAADLDHLTTYEADVTTAVTDPAGNPLQQSYHWTFTTAPEPKVYYFPWYDMKSSKMSDWVVMGNPEAREYAAGFDIRLNSISAGGSPIIVQPGSTESTTYPGQVGGPVAVAALDGESQIVSKRTLYGGSLEEIVGVEADKLDSHYYFTWYDSVSAGARDWILVSNPGVDVVDVDVYIAGNRMPGSPFRVDPGMTITPEFKSVIGGPVEVFAYAAGNQAAPRDVIVSQRVTWKGDFMEVMGIPATGLSSEYLFTWYDMKSAGAKSWILAANPHADKDMVVEVWIAGRRMADPKTGNPYFDVPAGASVTPTFPGVMNGPVVVKGFDAGSYDPGDPTSPALSFYSTQRSLFGATFEEVVGYGADRLSASYFYSWYDNASAGSRNWVLVANPGDQQVVAEVWIAGARMSTVAIDPGTTRTPSYPGVMNGPVEVRGFLASGYDPNNPGAPNAEIFSSQRVLWRGNFNEVTGTVID
ncbi:MAG: M4 family metallopeptidase [Thermoleophilia bacterium]